MKRLLALALLVVAGCSYNAPPADPQGIAYYHDEAHRVSCWTFGGGRGSYTAAISCLPDSQVAQP
jgi:hypothetical protein